MSKEMTGLVTLNLDRQPKAEFTDAARLALVIEKLEVADDASFRRAGEIRGIAAARVKAIEDEFEQDKKLAHATWKSITERIGRWTLPYKTLIEEVDKKLKPYLQAVEAATKQAEENLRAAGEAEKKDLIDQAKRLRREGKIREAKELEAQAGSVEVDVTLPDASPSVEGLQDRRTWVVKMDNLMELIVAVAEGKCPLMHTVTVQGKQKELPILEVNMSVMNHLVKKLQKDMRIPGAHAEQEIQFASRRP